MIISKNYFLLFTVSYHSSSDYIKKNFSLSQVALFFIDTCIDHSTLLFYFLQLYNLFLVKGSLEARYMCCSSDLMVQGCCIADSHVTSTALLTDLDTFVEVTI